MRIYLDGTCCPEIVVGMYACFALHHLNLSYFESKLVQKIMGTRQRRGRHSSRFLQRPTGHTKHRARWREKRPDITKSRQKGFPTDRNGVFLQFHLSHPIAYSTSDMRCTTSSTSLLSDGGKLTLKLTNTRARDTRAVSIHGSAGAPARQRASRNKQAQTNQPNACSRFVKQGWLESENRSPLRLVARVLNLRCRVGAAFVFWRGDVRTR